MKEDRVPLGGTYRPGRRHAFATMTTTTEGLVEVAGGDPTGASGSGSAPRGGRWWASGPWSSTAVQVGVLSLAVVVPLAVALVALRDPSWLPLSDVALIEMRVRDVGGSHTPLIGVYGRFEGYGQTGSHPGPLMFYVLWPVYALAGADGWALQLATVAANLVAAAGCIWIGHRRGGWPLALAVTGLLTVLARAYGAEKLAEAWNPNVAALWWVVFLLAVWSVLCDDLAMLPVAVFAGSLCVQSHVGYAALVAGLGMAMVAWLATAAVRRRGGDAPAPARKSLVRWPGLAAGLAILLWLPPLVDQVTHDPGNLSVLVEGFRHPTAERAPFDQAVEAWLAHLDPSELVTGQITNYGSALPGLAMLGVWLATVVLAWRGRHPALVRLHAVTAGAVVLGLVSMSRVLGPIWSYLTLWAWGTTAVMVLAVVSTLVAPGARPAEARPTEARPAEATPASPALTVPRPRRPRSVLAALGGVTVLAAAVFTVDTASAKMPDSTLSVALDRLAWATVDTLASDPYDCGDRCRYLVTWADPIYLGSQGHGMLVELERRGLDVGARPSEAVGVRDHRVIDPREADAIIHVAVTDAAIDDARARPGAELLAYAEPYGREARERHRRLRARTADALEAEGFTELAEQAARPEHQAIVPMNDRMSDDLRGLVQRLNDVYRPSAVVLLPPAGGP